MNYIIVGKDLVVLNDQGVIVEIVKDFQNHQTITLPNGEIIQVSWLVAGGHENVLKVVGETHVLDHVTQDQADHFTDKQKTDLLNQLESMDLKTAAGASNSGGHLFMAFENGHALYGFGELGIIDQTELQYKLITPDDKLVHFYDPATGSISSNVTTTIPGNEGGEGQHNPGEITGTYNGAFEDWQPNQDLGNHTEAPAKLNFNFTPTDNEHVESITISNIPNGVKIYDGLGNEVTVVNGSVTIPGADIDHIYIKPPHDSSTDFTLDFDAHIVDPTQGHTATLPGTVTVVVDAAADQPTCVVGWAHDSADADHTISIGENVTVHAQAHFGDVVDGSEQHYLLVSLPTGWSNPNGYTEVTINANDPRVAEFHLTPGTYVEVPANVNPATGIGEADVVLGSPTSNGCNTDSHYELNVIAYAHDQDSDGSLTTANDNSYSQAPNPICVDVHTPQISVNDTCVVEPHTGTATMTFTISLDSIAAQDVTVSYLTLNGLLSGLGLDPAHSAIGTPFPGLGDYTDKIGYVTIPAGSDHATVSITVNADNIDELPEKMTLNLIGATNGQIVDHQGVGTIYDDPKDVTTVSISDANPVHEPASAGSPYNYAVFYVTLSQPSSTPVTVNYTTHDGTATAGSDYVAQSGSLTFPAGVTTLPVYVPIKGDNLYEGSENFTVEISNAHNGGGNVTITDPSGLGTILDDPKDVPQITINDVTTQEPALPGATTTMTFTVTLDNPSQGPVTVDYHTVNGSAGNLDYTGQTGTVTFAPGQTTATITVTINGDDVKENNETYSVVLSNPTGGAQIQDGTGVGTILDNETAPHIVASGGGETVNIQVGCFDNNGETRQFIGNLLQEGVAVSPANLSGNVSGPVHMNVGYAPTATFISEGAGFQNTVGWVVLDANGHPTEGHILWANASQSGSGGSLNPGDVAAMGNIPAGSTIAFFLIPNGYGSNPSGTLTDGQTLYFKNGHAYTDANYTHIVASDGNGAVSNPVWFTESTADNIDGKQHGIQGISADHDGYLYVGFEDLGGIGQGDNDYNDVVFKVDLGQGNYEHLGVTQIPVVVDITDVDSANMSKAVVTAHLGDGDTLVVPASTANITVTYDAAHNTITFTGVATVAEYEALMSQVTINVGHSGANQDYWNIDTHTDRSITYTVTDGSGLDSNTSTIHFPVNVSQNGNPCVFISDSQVTEPHDGKVAMTFTVTLSDPSINTTSVQWHTVDGTATSGSGDYDAVSGIVTFNPGETTKTITVYVDADTVKENDETFNVVLSNPVNGNINDGTGVGTIHDNFNPPDAVNDVYTVKENSVNNTFNILVNDTDPDHDVLTVIGASAAQHGNVSINPDGSINYTPTHGYFGDDTFTYTISDGHGGTDTATVTVHIPQDQPTLNVPVETVCPPTHDQTITGTDSGYYYDSHGHLKYTDGSDTLTGGYGNDLIHGLSGNDHLNGNNGNDCIFGDSGNDELHGNNGNDVLVGGAGVDTYFGGHGSDTFVIDSDDICYAAEKGNGDNKPVVIGDEGSKPAGDVDTVVFSGGMNVDFTQNDSTNDHGVNYLGGKGTLQGIDILDLETDANGNHVKLDFSSASSITDGDNKLFIFGGSNDAVTLNNDASHTWTNAGSQLGTDGNTYVHYTAGTGNNVVDVYVDQHVQTQIIQH